MSVIQYVWPLLLSLALQSSRVSAGQGEGAGRGGSSGAPVALVAQDWLCDYAMSRRANPRKTDFDYFAQAVVYQYAASSALRGELVWMGTSLDPKVNGCRIMRICLEFSGYQAFSDAMKAIRTELGWVITDRAISNERFLFEIVSGRSCIRNSASGETR